MPRLPVKPALTVSSPTEKPLTEMIRDVARCVESLLSKGFNRRAVVVLLVDETKMSKRAIERVLDGLGELERTYCK